MKFFVMRVFFAASDGKQSNSIQAFETEVDAKKRFWSILASDIGSDNILFEIVQIVRDDGICVASQVFDNREEAV